MSSTAIATVTKMLESLPEPAQDQVVEHLREYLEDLQDELQWDALFRTQPQLIACCTTWKSLKVSQNRWTMTTMNSVTLFFLVSLARLTKQSDAVRKTYRL